MIYGKKIIVNKIYFANENSTNLKVGSVVGMYDTIFNSFFTNSGTGDFIIG